MIKGSVPYVLCRIEDDSSLTIISEHQNVVDGVAAGKHRVKVEDFDFGYGLDLLRAGVPSPGLRPYCVPGWVAEMGGRVAGCAHPSKNLRRIPRIQAYIA